LGVNVGHPIVTNGEFVASCAKVRELIELSFRVVRGGLWDRCIRWRPCSGRGREVMGFFCPHWFEWCLSVFLYWIRV